MKNLFGINITNSKKNDIIDGDDFISQRVSPELNIKLDLSFSAINNCVKKQSLPLPLTMIQILSTFLLIISVSSDIKILFDRDLTYTEAYHNAPYIFWGELINLLIFIIIKIIEIIKKRKVTESYEYSVTSDLLDIAAEEASTELGIPDNTELIDILTFRYKSKNNKDKLVDFGLYKYKNIEYMAYIKDGNLCISDLYFVMSIPLSSMNNIIKSKNRATFPYWKNSKKSKYILCLLL